MKELIERLESATEGSRELDEAIRDAVLVPAGKMNLMWRPGAFADFDAFVHPNGKTSHALDYTRYIDAALTLVPDGWHWSASFDKPKCDACVWLFNGDIERYGIAATPALALCVASLRARA